MAQRDAILDGWIVEFLTITDLMNQCKAERDRLAEEMKAYMTINGIEVYSSPSGKASYKQVISKVIDTRALRAELPRTAERFEYDRCAMQLRVS